jgi:hypothetical protein
MKLKGMPMLHSMLRGNACIACQQNLGHCLRMHALLRAVGVLALVAGLGFVGNGFRFLAYPGERFMMVYYGAGMAVVGLLLIIFSRPSDEPRV